jgi:hypothetical protein
MHRKTRLVVLFTALAGVGAWAAFGGKDADRASAEVVPAAAPQQDAAPGVVLAAAPATAPEETMPERPSLEQMSADPFNVEPPQQAPAAAAPPPAPVAVPAPPLPYRFAGRLQIGDAMEVYLAKGDELIQVKKGDKLDGQYRVEKIGRTEMTLVHLASGTRAKLEYSPPIKEDEAAVAEAPVRTQRAAARSGRTAALPGAERGG